jgi:hypothetical protein
MKLSHAFVVNRESGKHFGALPELRHRLIVLPGPNVRSAQERFDRRGEWIDRNRFLHFVDGFRVAAMWREVAIRREDGCGQATLKSDYAFTVSGTFW